MNPSFYISICAALVVGAIATITDLKGRKIPNWLTAVGTIAGLLFWMVRWGGQGAYFSITGAFAAALVPLLLFRAKAMGGGDVKLFFAIGSLVGLEIALEIELVAFGIGSVVGICIWIKSGTLFAKLGAAKDLLLLRRRTQHAPNADLNAINGGTSIPFAPAIFGATIITIGTTAHKGLLLL